MNRKRLQQLTNIPLLFLGLLNLESYNLHFKFLVLFFVHFPQTKNHYLIVSCFHFIKGIYRLYRTLHPIGRLSKG